jgi:uncharacterized protein YqhQ
LTDERPPPAPASTRGDDDLPSPHGASHFYGGQAVIEGVMMRGARVWAIAVRRPDGAIWLERHPVSDFPDRRPIFKKPMVRGIYALVDALRIGARALTISANQSVEEEEQLTKRQMGGSLAVAMLLFIGIFIVVPNVGLAALHDRIGSETLYHIVEGLVRVVIFLGYIMAISLLADIRRVFAYHGGEHRTIAAWEHDEPLEPSAVQKYSTLHVRCGTNFLIMVMLIAIVVYSVAGAIVPTPDTNVVGKAIYHIVLRIVLLPVVAGLAYEGLRLGARFDNLFVRALMKPGLWLQMITTKPADEDQVEVAIRAFEAVVPRADLAGRTVALPSPVVWGPDEAPPDVYGLPKPAAAERTEPAEGSVRSPGDSHER